MGTASYGFVVACRPFSGIPGRFETGDHGESFAANGFQIVNDKGVAANMSEEGTNIAGSSVPTDAASIPGGAPGKELTPAALRALAEADERRRAAAVALPTEYDGPSGEEPTRYGDWERKGLAVDF